MEKTIGFLGGQKERSQAVLCPLSSEERCPFLKRGTPQAAGARCARCIPVGVPFAVHTSRGRVMIYASVRIGSISAAIQCWLEYWLNYSLGVTGRNIMNASKVTGAACRGRSTSCINRPEVNQLDANREDMSRYSRDLVSIILALILLVGCGSGVGSPTSTVPALALTQISLSPTTASIHVGEEQTFVAQGFDQYHNPMTGITFTWTPSNDGANGSAIATFHSGVATGVSAGTMHVTASALGVTSTPAALIVLLPPPVLTSMILTPSNPTIFSTGSQQFVAAGVDQYGNSVSGVAFTFSSSDLDVATISSTGLATGVGGPNAGTSIITASAQGVSGSTTLTTVRPDAVLTMISVTPLTATVQAGNTVSFTVTGLDQFSTTMSGLTFAWVSSNPTIAAVNALNSEGKNSAIVTGIAINGGSVTLTASAQGIASPPVQLTVTRASPVLTTINVSPTNASIAVGSTQAFTVSGTDQFGAAFTLPLSNSAAKTRASPQSMPPVWARGYLLVLRK